MISTLDSRLGSASASASASAYRAATTTTTNLLRNVNRQNDTMLDIIKQLLYNDKHFTTSASPLPPLQPPLPPTFDGCIMCASAQAVSIEAARPFGRLLSASIAGVVCQVQVVFGGWTTTWAFGHRSTCGWVGLVSVIANVFQWRRKKKRSRQTVI